MKEQLKRIKLALLLGGLGISLTSCNQKEKEIVEEIPFESLAPVPKLTPKQVEKVEEQQPVEITISAVGDCTLGTDTHFGYENTLPYVLEEHENDYGYFFQGVESILENDDLTIANLETTLTDATEDYRVDKKFNFKGDASYTNILKEGSVEVVNLANNHTFDYGNVGYEDTIENLNRAQIPYFGYDEY